jgi:hypothetical protein
MWYARSVSHVIFTVGKLMESTLLPLSVWFFAQASLPYLQCYFIGYNNRDLHIVDYPLYDPLLTLDLLRCKS